MSKESVLAQSSLELAVRAGRAFGTEPVVPGIDHAEVCAHALSLRARVAELEEVVRAADRMLKEAASLRDMLSEWHGGLCQCRKCKVDGLLAVAISDYDSKRDALGEIGGGG